jgi:hypothetical protein
MRSTTPGNGRGNVARTAGSDYARVVIRRGRWAWGLAGLAGSAAIAASLSVLLVRQQKPSILRPEGIQSLGDSGVGEASEHPRVVGEGGASCLTTSAAWPQPSRKRLCFHKLEPLIPPLIVDVSRIRVALPLWKLPPGLRSDGILFPEEPTGIDGFALVDISVTAERLVHADRCPESLQSLRAQFVDEEGRQHLLCEGQRPGDHVRTWMTHAVLSDLGGKATWGQAFPLDRRFLSGDHVLFGMLQGRLILASGQNNHWYVHLVGVAHGEHSIPLPYSFHVAQGTLIAIRRESDVEDDGEELGYWRTSIDSNGVARHERLRSPPIAARPTLWGYPPTRPSEREPPVFGSEATGEPELLLPIPLPTVTEEDVPTGQAIRFSLDGAIPLGGLKTAGPEAALREQGEDLVLHCSTEGPPLTVTTGSHLYARAICDSNACVAVYLAPLQTNFDTSSMDDPEFHILRADRERCR